jgi:hydroxyacylglutathione hydrolase
MFIKTFNTPDHRHPSYLIGSEATGEALVIDPGADVNLYLRAARQAGLTISHVGQTSLHPLDELDGALALAKATDAALYVSDHQPYAAPAQPVGEPVVIPVRDGDMWLVGDLRVQVTEVLVCDDDHLALLITDPTDGNRPLGVFSGKMAVTA